jgi:Putative prokaryotic signal transducing protein
MQEVAKSNDPVRLSFLTVLLRDAGIETVLLDQHASVMDGSIGAVPRRLMVADADYRRARRVLQEAGEG